MTESANATITDYYDAETFARIKAFADTKDTPCVVIDTATINRQYDELVEGFPYANVYYAVKANPAPQVLTCLFYTSPSPRDRTRSRMPSSARNT
mgnify:CR=1 FL=1